MSKYPSHIVDMANRLSKFPCRQKYARKCNQCNMVFTREEVEIAKIKKNNT